MRDPLPYSSARALGTAGLPVRELAFDGFAVAAHPSAAETRNRATRRAGDLDIASAYDRDPRIVAHRERDVARPGDRDRGLVAFDPARPEVAGARDRDARPARAAAGDKVA